MFDRYSFLEIVAGDVCFVDLFRSIIPVVPTECDVLIVGSIMTIIVHFTIYNTKYITTGSLRNSTQKSGKILRGRKDTLAPWFQHCGGERPRHPLHSVAFVSAYSLNLNTGYLLVTFSKLLTYCVLRSTQPPVLSVKFAIYDGGCNDTVCFGIKIRMDAAKLTIMRIARFIRVQRFGQRMWGVHQVWSQDYEQSEWC